MVDDPLVHPRGELHNRHHRHDRVCQGIWKDNGLRDPVAVSADHRSANSGLRRRQVHTAGSGGLRFGREDHYFWNIRKIALDLTKQSTISVPLWAEFPTPISD